MNARARAIEAELIHFFAEVVGVDVLNVDGVPKSVALIRPFENDEKLRRITPADVEEFSLSALAERIERL